MKLLDWILENLFAVVIVASVIAQIVKAVRGQKEPGEDASPSAPEAGESQFGDPEEDERTRRIREDIRRRIAERQGGPTPPLAESGAEFEAEPPVFEPEPPVVPRSIISERAPEAAAALSRIEAQRRAEILEQQTALAERMRELEGMKAAAQRRAAFEALSVSPAEEQRKKTRGAVVDDLRSPEALRRAFVLREVLGPPVALRR